MDRVDFYFRQLVTESEMDLAFDQVQDRIESADSQEERGFDGIVRNAEVTESSPPALTVEVSGDAVGFVPNGKRVAWASSETVDVSEDKLGSSTAVGTPGNSKILSVFVEFAEDLQDLRLDGNSMPVYWKRLASHNIYVLQSAEAPSPTPVSLQSDALLLCDISLAYGQTTIVNANIDLSRRQDTYRNEGNFLSDIVEGRLRDALGQLHDDFNQFAEDIDSNDSGKGASLVGVDAFSATPTGGSALGFPDTDIQDALEDLITDLTGAPGATKIGTSAKSGSTVTLPSPLSLSASTVDDQVADLLDYMETLRNTPFSASAVSYSPHDYIASTDVQAAIDELIDDLQSQAGGAGNGAYEIGYKGVTQVLHSTTFSNMDLPAASVEATLDTIANRLAGMLQTGGDTVEGAWHWGYGTSPHEVFDAAVGDDYFYRKDDNTTLRQDQTVNWEFLGSDGLATAMTISGIGDLTLLGDIACVDVGTSGDLGVGGNLVTDLIPSGAIDLGSGSNKFADGYIDNIFAAKITAAATVTNGDAIVAIGDGSGSGIDVTGGDLSGIGIEATGGSPNGDGGKLFGTGSGAGAVGTGGATGVGLAGYGGATSGPGGYFEAVSGNSPGLQTVGYGSGAGISATGGSSDGAGVIATGGFTNGNAIEAHATGNGIGIAATGGVTGIGILGYGGSTSGIGVWAQSVSSSPISAALHIDPQDTEASAPAKGNIQVITANGKLVNHTGSAFERQVPQNHQITADEAETYTSTPQPFASSQYSIPAGTLRVGSTIRVKIAANVTTYGGGDALSLHLYDGTSTLSAVGTISAVGGFQSHAIFTVRAVGASGSIYGSMSTQSVSSGNVSGTSGGASGTLDTTQAISLTLYGTSSTGGAATLEQFTIDVT